MRNRFVLMSFVFLLSTGATIRDLGTLPGGGGSVALAVNEYGTAVGYSFNAAGVRRAVVFEVSGAVTEIPIPAGVTGDAHSINVFGMVVGEMGTPARAFAWSPGAATVTDLSGGALSRAFGVNNDKVIVGQKQIGGLRAVKWPAGSTIAADLGGFGGLLDFAAAIAQHPVIAGTSRYPGGALRATLWNGKKLIDLGALPGGQSWGRDLVVRSWPDYGFTQTFVVGDSLFGPGLDDYHAFLWTAGSMTDLGTLPKWHGSRATAVNKRVHVVGDAWELEYGGTIHAVIWRDGTIEDLNTWISDPGWTLQVATDISDSGLIVGWGTHLGEGRAFLLTP